MARRVKGQDAATVAVTVQTLAVLLQAGVVPVRAWEHLAASGDPAAQRVSTAVGEGVPIAEAIATRAPDPVEPRARGIRRRGRQTPRRTVTPADAPTWIAVSAAWGVATSVGAPLSECLRGLAIALRDAHETADEVRIALAEPAGTARLMNGLPLVGVVLGFALGFDVLGVLFRNPLGLASLTAGLALVVAARHWTNRLVTSATTAEQAPGLDAELVAIALSGGVSIERAHLLVLQHTGASPAAATEEVLALSRSAGVPAVELLRAASTLARHRARVEGRLRAARLSTRLLLPLGVCTLPAFLLLGVVPMLLSVLSVVPAAL
ncbi:pilus assembly protein TadB [Microbacterium sp. SLBN-146]|uniref:pilus assembly protein TadB n=1 Tax=Microbacterium sp. SLBN-146 TaxID=2768457 RepID=UPI001151E7DA|nr:pilus assembly protein TadB [Microbacterium sp. SLBN-146]TQJ31379.1 tight adherence protein B [Microbacterium sp. SLBN-146]